MSETENKTKRKKAPQIFEFDGLNERQLKAVELLETGEYTKMQIADMVGVHRNTITEWCKNDRFRAALKECAEEKIKAANRQMEYNISIATSKILDLINCGDKDTEFKAAKYLLDRIFGKTTAKIQIEDNDKDESRIDIEAELEAMDNGDDPIDVDFD